MSGQQTKRLLGAALLTAAILLFMASLSLLEHRLELLTRSVVDTNSEASWSLTQTRFELERMLHAIDNAAGQLGFSIEGSSFPNWEGTVQRRQYTLEGTEPSYRVPPRADGSIPVSVWRHLE